MSIAHKTPLLNVLTILAILASPAFANIITNTDDCERMLRMHIAKVSKITEQDIEDPEHITCTDMSIVTYKVKEKGLLSAEINDKRYQFIAVDKDDAHIIELYKAGGMEPNLIHFGEVENYDLYLWPREEYEITTWEELDDYENIDTKVSIVNKLKDMAAKMVYPKADLPSSVYYNKDEKIFVFLSHNDLQKEGLQAVGSWMTQLLAKLPKTRRVVVVEPKSKQEIQEQRDKFLAFLKEPPANDKYFDALLSRMRDTEVNIKVIERGDDLRHGGTPETEAERMYKDAFSGNSHKRYQKSKDDSKASVIGENKLLKEPETIKRVDQPKSDHIGTKLTLDKSEVPVKKEIDDTLRTMISNKDRSKTISEKAVESDFDYTPFVIGGFVVVGLVTIVVAAFLVRRK